MKDIIRELGGTILAVTCTVMILLLLFGGIRIEGHSGASGILGAAVASSEMDAANASLDAIRSVQERPRPTAAGGRVRVGAAYLPGEAVAAQDAEGNPAEIRVLSVRYAATGEDVTSDVHDGARLIFNKPGIYEAETHLTDSAGASGVCYVYIHAEE